MRGDSVRELASLGTLTSLCPDRTWVRRGALFVTILEHEEAPNENKEHQVLGGRRGRIQPCEELVRPNSWIRCV